MPGPSVLVATPSRGFFEHVHSLLLGRTAARLLPQPVGDGRVLPAVRRDRPDVLIVDGDGFGERGIGFIRRVSALELPTRTLLLHADVTEARVAHVLCCGGAGCLGSGCTAYQLLGAIEAVHKGELWASRKTVAETLRQLRMPPDAAIAEAQQALSRREREIVERMQMGMTNKEIGRALGISDMTVKTHAHNIFHKLEVSGRRLLGVRIAADAVDAVSFAPIEPRSVVPLSSV